MDIYMIIKFVQPPQLLAVTDFTVWSIGFITLFSITLFSIILSFILSITLPPKSFILIPPSFWEYIIKQTPSCLRIELPSVFISPDKLFSQRAFFICSPP